jgi:ZIP family zinc transporter
MIILIAIGAFVATFLGGLFALRMSDRLHLILGFSAGAVIAVAFFDLMPEALDLAKSYPTSTVTSVIALGFILFMLVDRFVSPHTHEDVDYAHEAHVHVHRRGLLGAGSLSLHSFLDGLAIGIAFHVSAAVAIIVAVAVLTHDFSDGINTVSIIRKNGGSYKKAFAWLAVDATAPVIGVIVGSFVIVPEATLGLVLALFSGFFLYIGASDLLPESHHAHPTYWTTFTTILGFAVLYTAIHFAGM